MIQPLDPGKVAAVHVENGQRVRAGDLLQEFDPAETPAPPLAVLTMLTICAFFAIALAWSFYGRLDGLPQIGTGLFSGGKRLNDTAAAAGWL